MNKFLLVPMGKHFQLTTHQNLADIKGYSSKSLNCHPGNREYPRVAHVCVPPHLQTGVVLVMGDLGNPLDQYSPMLPC